MDTGTVSRVLHETNVRVPLCAFDALKVIVAKRGISRDATLRALLVEYLEAQKNLSENDRLTHTSTLLRYPLHRKKEFLLTDHDVEVVRLRLRVDSQVLEKARSYAFSLPGQPLRRGHEDYQARLLTDAVMTAIALVQPFEDYFLKGLLPLIRHRAALELWHLVVELTMTRVERDALTHAGNGNREQRIAELIREDEEAWHHDYRFVILRRFARQAFGTSDARVNEIFLHRGRRGAGRGRGRSLDDLGQDLHHIAKGFEDELIGEVKSDWKRDGLEGRGGTAVWRASHRAALEEVPAWLAGGTPGPLQVESGSNGWSLITPDDWQSLVNYSRLAELPAPWGEHVNVGRVLEFEHRRWRVLWPVTAAGQPVGRLDTAFSACPQKLTNLQCVEILLLEPWQPLQMSPNTAVRLGLLSPARASTVITNAVKLTQLRMYKAIEAATYRLNAEAISDLEAEVNSSSGFAKACVRHSVKFEHRHDQRWRWWAPSLAVAVGDSEISDAALSWLGKERVLSWRDRLREAEQAAWHRAIEQFGWPVKRD